jgi:cell division protein FtsI/penicillin-binding protein 2
VDYSLTEIVTHSSNVGAVMIGQKLGKERLLDYFSRFGLSRRTGIDFPGEAGGFTPKISQFSASTMGNLPFGQGLTVTPVQLVRGMAAIANRGTLVTPHLLLKQSSAVATFPANPEPIISAKAANQATVMLADVVRQGTGTAAKVKGYEVAGKTGTAQKVANGRYMKGVYISSFVGYLPAGNPQIVILVALDAPRKGLYGGTVAAPAFREIASFCMSHLRIAPAPSVGRIEKPEKSKGGNKTVSPHGKSTTRTVDSTSTGQ